MVVSETYSTNYLPVGLQNLGNTCFCNSVLQALTSSDVVYQAIEASPHICTCQKNRSTIEDAVKNEASGTMVIHKKSGMSTANVCGDYDELSFGPEVSRSRSHSFGSSASSSSNRSVDGSCRQKCVLCALEKHIKIARYSGIENDAGIAHFSSSSLFDSRRREAFRSIVKDQTSNLPHLNYRTAIANNSSGQQRQQLYGQSSSQGRILDQLSVSDYKRYQSTRATVLSPHEIVDLLPLLSTSLKRGRQEDSHEFLNALLSSCSTFYPPSKSLDGNTRNDDYDNNGSRSGNKLDRESVGKKESYENRSHENSELEESQNGLRIDKNVDTDCYLSDLFRGSVQNSIKCCTCGTVSTKIDPIMGLQLDISRAGSVLSALGEYCRVETLSGTNAYDCSKCKRRSTAERDSSIQSAPHVLAVQLKRFYHTRFAHENKKLNHFVEYGLELDLNPYLSDQNPYLLEKIEETIQIKNKKCTGIHDNGNAEVEVEAEDQCRDGKVMTGVGRENIEGVGEDISIGRVEKIIAHYSTEHSRSFLSDRTQMNDVEENRKIRKNLKAEKSSIMQLFAIIVHLGCTINNGHYVAYVRCSTSGQWHRADDNVVTHVTAEEALGQKDAYLLFYENKEHSLKTFQNSPSTIVPSPYYSSHLSSPSSLIHTSLSSPFTSSFPSPFPSLHFPTSLTSDILRQRSGVDVLSNIIINKNNNNLHQNEVDRYFERDKNTINNNNNDNYRRNMKIAIRNNHSNNIPNIIGLDNNNKKRMSNYNENNYNQIKGTKLQKLENQINVTTNIIQNKIGPENMKEKINENETFLNEKLNKKVKTNGEISTPAERTNFSSSARFFSNLGNLTGRSMKSAMMTLKNILFESDIHEEYSS